METLNIKGPYINVSKYSDSKLGKVLSPGHPVSIKTLLGVVGTLRSAMVYIVTPNYPSNLLAKRSLKRFERNKIPKQTIDVPNYWAVVTYLLCLRIKEDQEVID